MISVLIPAHNEESYLNKTIENLYKSAKGDIEVLVYLNGYKQEVDKRAKVIESEKNYGERHAMNEMARNAHGDYLFRIDAHCTFSDGWDEKMLNVLEKHPKGLCVGVIKYLNKNWTQRPSHWYGLCKLLPNMEAKWYRPAKYLELPTVVPNMACTGCGMLISKDFYWEIGGADEDLSPMGAIGEEFAIKAHLLGDGVYTRTDVNIGHIFDTGGYSGVTDALQKLYDKYGNRYEEINSKFDWNKKGTEMTTKKNKKDEVKEVSHIVTQIREKETRRDDTDALIRKWKEVWEFSYVGDLLPVKEAIKKFGDRFRKVSEEELECI